jgi:hypothetical protein
MAKIGTFAQALLLSAIFFCTALASKAQTFNPGNTGFGNVVVQTTAPAKSVVLTNTLTVPLAISSIFASEISRKPRPAPLRPTPSRQAASARFWSPLRLRRWARETGL